MQRLCFTIPPRSSNAGNCGNSSSSRNAAASRRHRFMTVFVSTMRQSHLDETAMPCRPSQREVGAHTSSASARTTALAVAATSLPPLPASGFARVVALAARDPRPPLHLTTFFVAFCAFPTPFSQTSTLARDSRSPYPAFVFRWGVPWRFTCLFCPRLPLFVRCYRS
jgi:hypothetical protein